MSTTQITLIAFGVVVLLWIIGKLQEVSKSVKYIKTLNINQFLFITRKLTNMATQLETLSASLDAANEKVAKVAADVQHLHDLITQAGDNPTPEQWAAVQAKADTLNNSLQAVDDQTEDTTTQG